MFDENAHGGGGNPSQPIHLDRAIDGCSKGEESFFDGGVNEVAVDAEDGETLDEYAFHKLPQALDGRGPVGGVATILQGLGNIRGHGFVRRSLTNFSSALPKGSLRRGRRGKASTKRRRQHSISQGRSAGP